MKIGIEIDDREVRAALNRLAQAGGNLSPALQHVGEALMLSTKTRFQTGTAPDGSHWAPNSETTLLGHLGKYKGSYTKRGRLSKAGAGRASGKRPLIGESKSLSTTITYQVSGNALRVGSPMEYAGTQQFGAAKHSFSGGKSPWGDIPARPFLGLSDNDREEILAILTEHLDRALGRG